MFQSLQPFMFGMAFVHFDFQFSRYGVHVEMCGFFLHLFVLPFHLVVGSL